MGKSAIGAAFNRPGGKSHLPDRGPLLPQARPCFRLECRNRNFNPKVDGVIGVLSQVNQGYLDARLARGSGAISVDTDRGLQYPGSLFIDSSTEFLAMRPRASERRAENGVGTNECGQFSSRQGRPTPTNQIATCLILVYHHLRPST